MGGTLLEVEDLVAVYHSDDGIVRAVDGVSLRLDEGETLGLVGESACGKSATALAIMRLIGPREGTIAGGRVRWRGTDLLGLTEREMRRIRGGEIAMVFQDPFASLTPVLTVGRQLAEAIMLHRGIGRAAAMREARDALARVHIPVPGECLREYPHQLSGGMQQRVMIAMGLSCRPRLLIADEPTTALDVTIQAQILALLEEVQRDSGMALLLISHDLGVVSRIAGRVAVMYAGRIVEEGPAGGLLDAPRHPYTRALLRSMPRLGERRGRLEAISGSVPDPLRYPPGCRFHPRCLMRREVCVEKEPRLDEVEPGRRSACHFAALLGP
ncbi:MAG: ABC transporter ATP-binding protein [bacterium]|nr:ABC transporter ATP-binding protein [bacterium]